MYELTGDTAYNPYLLDGDVITVPFPRAHGRDRAARCAGPARYELVEDQGPRGAARARRRPHEPGRNALPIRVVRRNDQQQETFIDLRSPARRRRTRRSRDDDKVIVRGSEELQRTVLLIGAVVGADPLDSATTSRRLPFVEGDTVLSLIDARRRHQGARAISGARTSRGRAGAPPELIPIDLDALLVRRDFTADKPIAMGDTIVIPPMQYSVLVEGAVARAGMYPYNPQFGDRRVHRARRRPDADGARAWTRSS